MSLEVTCPGCGSPLKARDTMIGKKARCKKCQTSFRIPGQSATDSLGDSQALSVIGVPAPPLPDEPVPLAAAIDDFDFPVPFEKSPPSPATIRSSQVFQYQTGATGESPSPASAYACEGCALPR